MDDDVMMTNIEDITSRIIFMLHPLPIFIALGRHVSGNDIALFNYQWTLASCQWDN
jgi:hypothetical protein